jgi:peroxiredoxin
LVKTYNEFKNAGFEILGVASDDNKQFWTEAVQKDSLTWQNVSDLKGDKNKAALIYGVSYYPTNFLIDKNGIIIAKDLRGDALISKLHEVLK